MRKGKKEKIYIEGIKFDVYMFKGRSESSITHVLLRDTTSRYDNLDYIQGDYQVLVIEGIEDKKVSYENITQKDIMYLKKLMRVLIKDKKVSEVVKVFLAQIGGYEIWNKDLLEK